MPDYAGGTIWLQVAPSFYGVQDSIRNDLRQALAGVDKEVQASADRMEKAIGGVGEKSAKRFMNSFEALTQNRFKRIAKDFEVLTNSLAKGEAKRLKDQLAQMRGLDLSKVTNQAKFLDQSRQIRLEIQGMLDDADKGQRKLSQQARTTLGAIRQPLDEMEKAVQRWNAGDPRRAAALRAEQGIMAQQVRAQREMGAEFDKRSRAEQAHVDKISRAYAQMQNDILAGIQQRERAEAQAAERLQRQGAQQARAVRENTQLDISINKRRVAEQLREIQNEIRTLGADIKLDADLDVGAAMTRIASLRGALSDLESDAVNVQVDVDTTQAMIQLRMLESQVNKSNQSLGFMARAMRAMDAGSAANSVRVFNGVLLTTLALGPALIPVLAGVSAGIFGIGAAAIGALGGIGILLASFAGIGGALQAMSELDKQQRLAGAGGPAASRDAIAAQRQAIADARSIADAQRGLARARRDAAAMIADADRRIADAELGVAEAHRRAADMTEDASRRVDDALDNLNDARRDAARAAEDAADRVQAAEERVADTQENARRAQERLNEARRQAVRDLEDLNNQLDDARLGEREATFAVEEALVHLNVVLEDPQATQRERDKAQLAYDQAVEALEQQRLETQRLEVDTAKANEAGVDGSDRVRDAKESIKDANDAVLDAEKALADAREDQAESAVEHQERIRDAKFEVVRATEAQAEAEREAARVVMDAEQQLSDARAERAEAAVAANERVTDASRNLSRALQDQSLRAQEAATATGAVATATDNLNEALLGMSPAAVAFATWLFSLKPLLDDVVTAIQTGFLPGLQAGLSTVIDRYGPAFVRFIGEMASVAGGLAESFGKMLASEQWASFFGQLGDLGPTFLKQFGDISMNFATAFMEIIRAFLPFMAEMGDWLVDISGAFADWAGGLTGSEGFQAFIDYLRDSLPLATELLKNLGEIFVNLLIGLAPYADDLARALISFTGWLASMPPDRIAQMALAIGAVVISIQALAGILSVIGGLAGLFGGLLPLLSAVGTAFGAVGGALAAIATPVGLAVVAVGLLVGAFVWAYNNVEWFRTGVDTALAAVGEAFQAVYQNVIQPVAEAIGSVLDWLTTNVIEPLAAVWTEVWQGIIGPIIQGVWEGFIQPTLQFIGGAFEVVWNIIKTVSDAIYQIIRYVLAPVFEWLWEHTVGPIFRLIGNFIKDTWEDVIRPALRSLAGFIEDHVAPAVKTGMEVLKGIWNGILDIFRAPIRWVIETVFNDGLIAAFNWLATKVPGMTKLDDIPVPKALLPGGGAPARGGNSRGGNFAEGGVLPGYTPGRDVHQFYSPSAGYLNLSGGEGIARPELVRAIGEANWNAANRAARAGQVDKGVRYLGGFADGGVLGWLGDAGEWFANAGRNVADFASGAFTNLRDFVASPIGTLKSVVSEIIDRAGIRGLLASVAKGFGGLAVNGLGGIINRATASDSPSGASGGSGGGVGMGWQAQVAALKAVFPGALITSAFRPGAITATGFPSYHGMGRAIDIAPNMAIFNWLSKTFPNSRELYFTPAGLSRWIRNGLTPGAGAFSPVTVSDHKDHIHWAMNQGGILPTLYDTGGDVSPGLTLVANKTQKPESIVTDQWKNEMRAKLDQHAGPVVDARGAYFGAGADEIADELMKRRRDELALTGVFDDPGVF